MNLGQGSSHPNSTWTSQHSSRRTFTRRSSLELSIDNDNEDLSDDDLSPFNGNLPVKVEKMKSLPSVTGGTHLTDKGLIPSRTKSCNSGTSVEEETRERGIANEASRTTIKA